jgi:hypothetical protein
VNPENLRNWLSSVLSDLRARTVLPILALLVAAAVAIPLLLSHAGKAASLAPLPPAPTVTVPTADVSAGTGGRHEHEPAQNYLTGPSHNPFVTTTTAAKTTTGTGTSATAGGASTSVSTSSSASNSAGVGAAHTGSAGSGTQAGRTQPVARTVTVATPAATTTVARTTTVPATLRYANFEVEASLLQTGAADTPTVFHNLSRDQLLPTDEDTFAAFIGVRTDLQTAVFVLTDDTTVTGAGECAPSASRCTFLSLLPGQRVTIVVQAPGAVAATYTLAYDKVTDVRSNASTVTVDESGATDVKQGQTYLPPLKTIRYSQYTGLLSIHLGLTSPVTP